MPSQSQLNIDLKLKRDRKELLSLHYYTIGVMQHMILDATIGRILLNLAKEISSQENAKEELEMKN